MGIGNEKTRFMDIFYVCPYKETSICLLFASTSYTLKCCVDILHVMSRYDKEGRGEGATNGPL